MSSLTEALLSTLSVDLEDHLDPYQFCMSQAGEPIWPDATVNQVAAYQLASKLLSKFKVAGVIPEDACLGALEKFTAANDRCGSWELRLNDSIDEALWGELRVCLGNFFDPSDGGILSSAEDWVNRGGVGSGASIKALATDFFTKVFDSPLSYTKEDLLYIWERTVCKDDRWFYALAKSAMHHIPTAVEGNKLSFVMKNTKVARTICTEPTINMWLQLGQGKIIADRLSEVHGITLSRQQDVNRELAEAASNGADICTIDLASASDSISCGFLKAILPRSTYSALDLTRCPSSTLPSGEQVALNMISTMGNGYTFPLQTAIFAAVVHAAHRVAGVPLIKRGAYAERNFAVFGDDIICSKRAYRLVVRLLTICGFTVNVEKSFSQGLFYESCGADFFAGAPVRPFYIKGVDKQEDLYKAINGLNRWSAVTGILLPNSVAYLQRQLRGSRYYVPCYESDDAGIQVPFDKVPRRFIRHSYPGSAMYLCRVPETSWFGVPFVDFDEEAPASCIGSKSVLRNYNPLGLWISFLHGSVRGCKISVRQTEVAYKTRRKVTPHWDTLSPLLSRLKVGWSSWSGCVRATIQ